MQYSRERLIRWFHEGRARSREVFAIPRPESYLDRKSTRLNSSHSQISYAVFCLKKKTAVLVQYRHGHPLVVANNGRYRRPEPHANWVIQNETTVHQLRLKLAAQPPLGDIRDQHT